MSPSRIVSAWLLPWAALFMLACAGGADGPGGGPVPAPEVAVLLTPGAADLESGDRLGFAAQVTGAPSPGVTWEVLEADGGSVDAAGLYTAPAGEGTFHVRASSTARPSASAVAAVRVKGRVTVAVAPATAALPPGGVQAFTASVSGTTNTAVTWTATGGTVSPAGLYTAPAVPGGYRVRATSVADPRRFGEAAVTVAAAPQPPAITSFTASPASITPGQGSTLAWAVAGATGLSINQGIGSVTGTSSRVVTPAATTTYTLTATNAAGSISATATVTVNPTPPTPLGHLLLTASRLQQLRSEAGSGGIAWTNLRNNVETHLASTSEYDTGAENMATAYLVGGDARFAARAHWWAQDAMAQLLRRDSYYYFQHMVRPVAMTLNYCRPALSGAQAQVLADYLHASCHELWFANQGSGWGLDDPANNYHHSFLAGTAFAGYALKAAGDPRGQAWLDLVNEKLTRPGGVFAYLDRLPGGDWEEGANYGEGSKMHLSLALSVLAADGTNHFGRPFFAGSVRYAVYATQPGWNFLYPGGDLARESSMGVSPYTRAYIQPTVFWLADGPDRRLGQWYLTHAVSSYLDGSRSFNYRTGLWLDEVFRVDLPEDSPTSLPLFHRSEGTEWMNARSGWDADATSLSISGAPRIVQSHQHQDTGHFVIWKRDWLAADASTYSHSGLLWEPQGQNLLRVPGVVMHFDDVPVPGRLKHADRGAFFYAQVDATGLYQRRNADSQLEPLLNEHTREFVYLRPDTLVVFDRVDAKPAGVGYQWLMHLPQAPAVNGSRYALTRNGAGITLITVLGGPGAVVPDTDLEDAATSSRVAVEATGPVSRFLHLAQVAAGGAPAATAQAVGTAGSMRGLLWNGTAVLFSDRPRGQAPSLPVTYSLPDEGTHTHVLANLSGTYSLEVARGGGVTQITLRAGGPLAADANGLLTFSDAGPAAPPAIASFTATPAAIAAGQSSTLAWSVAGATSLSINQGVGSVTGTTSRVVTPAASTTYTLTATNATGSATATATVTVTAAPQPPVITSFTATPATITAGQSSTLAWTVNGATGLTLDQGIGVVTGTSFVVAPPSTRTYVLSATNAAGSVSASATVTVLPPQPASCGTMDLGIGADLRGTQVFSASSAWNRDISGDPVDPNSAALIASIGATTGLHGDFGAGLWAGGKIGIPYIVVGGQAKVPINFTAYGDESDPGPYPVPPGAPIEGDPAVPNNGDRHVLVLDRDTCTLYELYRAFPVNGGAAWNADSAAVWDLKGDTKRPLGWTSSDAAGLPVFPGLVRYDEVGAGEIRHALRFTASLTRRAFTPPATHWASSSTDANRPPMGMRVRLKAGFNISTFSPSMQVILRALKKYGMILADNGGNWFISGAPDERWNNGAIAELSQVKGSDFEVVRMDTIHTTIPAGTPPAIAAFTASPSTISAGQSTTLGFTVSGASTVIITPEIGVVTGGATSVTARPGATTTYTLTATSAGGVSTRTVTVTVTGGTFITPDDPGAADLRFTLHSGQDGRPISKWIYGYNGGVWNASMAPGTTLGRLGGNRWTAYNWETNASNAGSDWGPYSNDGYLSASTAPGEAVRPSVANAQAAGAGILVTVPLQGWVAADRNGNVDITQPVATRFHPSFAKKGAPFADPPSLTDGRVHQDEFVAWLDSRFPTAKTDADRPIFYGLDNEPDLWSSTHLEVQRSALRYDQLIPASIALAGAIKDTIPQALVFGPASYGWNGFVNLQNAPDAAGRDFLETYLAQLRTASDGQGRRLLDVLDLHWYSEAQGGGQRVVGGDNSAAVAAARIQAPRSLWDPAYTETSWITQWSTLGPIRLLPRIFGKIAAHNPGTKLAFTEYNHGGEDHISGGLAQADTLGIFGREGVFAANVWPLASNRAFSHGAFLLYRDFDGAGSAFGNTSFRALPSNHALASAYASLDAGNADRVVVVLLNKDTVAHSAGLALTHTRLFGRAEVYQLTASSPVSGGAARPQRLPDLTLALRNALAFSLPALSATVLVFRP